MLPQINSLQELTKRFSDDQVCRKYLEDIIWQGNPTCPHCGQNKPYKLKDGKTYRCSNKECKKDFTVTVGTVFEGSNVKLSKWFMAIYIATNHKKGISSCQLARDLGVTQRTAWFMLHRIREMVRPKQLPVLKGEVMIDHTYHGGKEKNKSKFRRMQAHMYDPSAERINNKIPVFGMIQKDGPATMIVVPDSKEETATPIMLKLIDQETVIVSDGATAFSSLKEEFQEHVIVNHAQGQYVNGRFTTNHIEAVFATLKRTVYGTYHSVSPKHLQRYCEECTYRFNTRKINDGARFNHTLRNSRGRLKYKRLIA
ncbi:MAG TPA: IS1595 family transposase [Ferruginibacter sp.]|nr:IS1595 family transposase [Ferruginibacter sp.]HNO98667.1 IS1595 family transposase [Ferruginibacter sp.]